MSRTLAILFALALPFGGGAADPPEPLKAPPRPLDSLKLPPGTVVIISSDPKDTFQKIDAVVISPEEYKRLLDAAEQMRKQAAPDRPEPPSVCRLSGKAEARGQTEVMRLRAVFEFTTVAAKTVVPLGGRKAAAVSATLDDGKLPVLQFTDDGYSATVETPGPHKLAIEWDVPLVSRGARGGERGFLLHLPGCPITLLEQIELPAGVTAARLRGTAVGTTEPPPARTLPVKDLLAAAPGTAVALGSVDAVELFWDTTAPAKPAAPLIVGGGDVAVRVDETTVTVTAKLAFRSLIGRVAEWKLLAPPGADVTAEGELAVSQTDDKSAWLIRAKEPGVDEVRITVQTRTSRKSGGVPVGPFQLLGAFRQQGVVRVTAPAQLRPRFSKLRADVTRRAPDADGDLAFTFSAGQNPAAAPWLVIDAESVRGEVRTQTSNTLTLTDTGWRLSCDIKASPVRTELERLDVDLPAGLQDVQASPPEMVETITPRRDLGPTRWQIRLARPKATDITIRLEGFYAVPAGVREAALLLPRAVQTFDRDGRVTVVVPDGWEARGGVAEWERDRPAEWGRPLEPGTAPHAVTLAVARTPARVDLTWGRAIAELGVQSTVDLTLDEQTAVARHRLAFAPSAVARQVLLRAAPGAVTQLRATDFDVKPVRDGEWVLALPRSPDRELAVLLNYTCKLVPKPNRTFEPALVWPAAATRCDSRVRVWMKPGTNGVRPALADGPWEELPAEPVPDRPILPALVLHGTGVDLPLGVHLTETGVALRPVADDVFIQVRFDEFGTLSCAARFRLRQAPAALDFELPSDVLNLKVLVNGSPADSYELLSDDGVPVVRVPARAGVRERVVTLMYQRPADRLAGTAAAMWRWQFKPPRLRGGYVGEVRWAVPLPAGCVPLSWNPGCRLHERWVSRLLPELRSDTPRDNVSIDAADAPLDGGGHTLVAPDLAPVQITAVPRAIWVAACSLVVLAFGGALAALRRRPVAFWVGLVLLTVVAGTGVVARPQPALAAAAAAVPGVVVLIPACAAFWFLNHRHRRRIDHMPGFARPRPAAPSSVHGSSARRRLDPSTVDAPDKA